MMINKYNWKEALMSKLRELSWHSPGGTGYNHENPQPGTRDNTMEAFTVKMWQ
jgi:hypothetical protein